MSNFMTLLTALLGSAGFALLFNVRKQLLPLAALGGALCWGAYLLAAPSPRSGPRSSRASKRRPRSSI